MTAMRTIPGGPYCFQLPFGSADEVNPALYNDLKDAINFRHGIGRMIACGESKMNKVVIFQPLVGLGTVVNTVGPYLGATKPNISFTGVIGPRSVLKDTDEIACGMAGGYTHFHLMASVHLPHFPGAYGDDVFIRFYLLNKSNSIGAPLIYIFRDYAAFLTKYSALATLYGMTPGPWSADAYVFDLATQGNSNDGEKFISTAGYIPSLTSNVTGIPAVDVMPDPGEFAATILYVSMGSATSEISLQPGAPNPNNGFIGTMTPAAWPAGMYWLGLKDFKLFQFLPCQ